MPDDDKQEARRIVLAGYCSYGKGLYPEVLKYGEDALRLDLDSTLPHHTFSLVLETFFSSNGRSSSGDQALRVGKDVSPGGPQGRDKS